MGQRSNISEVLAYLGDLSLGRCQGCNPILDPRGSPRGKGEKPPTRRPTCADRGAAAPPAAAVPPRPAAAALFPGAASSPPRGRIPRSAPARRRPCSSGSPPGPDRPPPRERAARRAVCRRRNGRQGPEMCRGKDPAWNPDRAPDSGAHV